MIEIEQINHSFNSAPLFHNFSLSIEHKTWTTFLGTSGVGKTTLLRLVAGLETPETGEITRDDDISYLSQAGALLPWKTALSNVSPFGASSIDAIHEALKQVGLAQHEHKYPHELSGGMQQRVALARILTENNPIVLLDEPFSALDAVTRHDLQDLACESLRGRTVIMVTHDPLEALRLSDQIIVLKSNPVTLTEPLSFTSPTPRCLEDSEVKNNYSTLMQSLHDAKVAI